MAQQDMNGPWELFGLGSATSQGYKERIEGSAHIFAYGYSGASTDYIPRVAQRDGQGITVFVQEKCNKPM